jgi:hypothetical protein
LRCRPSGEITSYWACHLEPLELCQEAAGDVVEEDAEQGEATEEVQPRVARPSSLTAGASRAGAVDDQALPAGCASAVGAV